MVCTKCYGTGEFFGQGMMLQKCKCKEKKSIVHSISEPKQSPRNIPIDRRSKIYRDAVADIMKIHPKITRHEAVEMFERKLAEG